ncbi:MAG: hypothetical protein H6741_31095 [Alphaproteobacteria bacterium]|nr:hypothetical protein [Alphaproteobacteria bacterium]
MTAQPFVRSQIRLPARWGLLLALALLSLTPSTATSQDPPDEAATLQDQQPDANEVTDEPQPDASAAKDHEGASDAPKPTPKPDTPDGLYLRILEQIKVNGDHRRITSIQCRSDEEGADYLDNLRKHLESERAEDIKNAEKNLTDALNSVAKQGLTRPEVRGTALEARLLRKQDRYQRRLERKRLENSDGRTKLGRLVTSDRRLCMRIVPEVDEEFGPIKGEDQRVVELARCETALSEGEKYETPFPLTSYDPAVESLGTETPAWSDECFNTPNSPFENGGWLESTRPIENGQTFRVFTVGSDGDEAVYLMTIYYYKELERSGTLENQATLSLDLTKTTDKPGLPKACDEVLRFRTGLAPAKRNVAEPRNVDPTAQTDRGPSYEPDEKMQGDFDDALLEHRIDQATFNDQGLPIGTLSKYMDLPNDKPNNSEQSTDENDHPRAMVLFHVNITRYSPCE